MEVKTETETKTETMPDKKWSQEIEFYDHDAMAFRMYLHDIEGCALLSESEEKRLTGMLHSGDKKQSAYATPWIRQRITRALNNKGSIIRLPVHVHDRLHKVEKAAMQLSLNGEEPGLERLAEVSGFSEPMVDELLNVTAQPVSMSIKICSEKDDCELGEFIPDTSGAHDPEQKAEEYDLAEHIEDLLMEKLNERERRIIRKRMGFDDDRVHSLEEIAKTEHVTRERIRQIEKTGLAKIRRCREAKALREYAEVTGV